MWQGMSHKPPPAAVKAGRSRQLPARSTGSPRRPHLLLRVLQAEGAVAGGGLGEQERLRLGRHRQAQRLVLANLWGVPGGWCATGGA